MNEGVPYFPSIETHQICSQYIEQTFHIQVMQPACVRGESTRFPVVYTTDGNFAFDVLKGISWSIQRTGYDAPRFILVGIGYPGDSPFAGSLLRVRDLTFPGYPLFNTRTPFMEGVSVASEGARDSHGAEDFQQFLEHELMRLIEANYATLAGERTYFGHSAGGGFGLFTLFTRTQLFKNYIVSSPGLTYYGESSAGVRYEGNEFLLQDAQRFIASGKALHGISLYMSVGAEEEFEPGLEQWQLTSSFYRLQRMLKGAAIPGLRLTAEVFPGETHMTVWPIAFTHGVQAVFNTGLLRSRQPKGAEA